MKALTTAVSGNVLRLGAGALGIAAVGVLLVQGSTAAFTASTDSKGNVVESGTVVLTNDGASTAMFNVGNLNGGQTVTRCINVAYDGSLTSDIKLEATASGDLAAGLATTVEVGSGATGGTAFDCAGFTAAGAALYSGSLADLGAGHGTYATGLGGFTNAAKGASKSYKITMTVSNVVQYQGKSAGVDFTWEAQGKDVATTNRVTP
jgi:hypothetical protein